MSDIFAGLFAGGSSIWNNERNIAFQRETNEHNEALMREAWGREDTAVQRRSADMAAAGFNPVLATGAAASSMPAVRAEAPQARENVGVSALQGAALARDLAIKDKQAQLLQSQKESIDLENKFKAGTVDMRITAALKEAENVILLAPYEWEKGVQSAQIEKMRSYILQNEREISNMSREAAEKYYALQREIEFKILRQELSEAEGKAAIAGAQGALLNLQRRDYESVGLSPSAIDRIMKVAEIFLKLFIPGGAK